MKKGFFGIVVIAWLFTGVACEDSLVFEGSSQSFEAKQSGPWVPTPSWVEKAKEFNITYVGAGPWKGSSGCGGSFSDGAQFLKSWVQNAFPQVSHVGGYSCRHINGNASVMSVHATGRALDIHIPLDGGEADNGLGDPIANYLLQHADKMGVQLIIWDRWIWSSGRTGDARSRRYNGAHPHHDHIHMELTPEAAGKGTPWFQDPIEPGAELCKDIIHLDGGVIDNESDCFQMFGPAKYWRTESVGYNGTLRWTNAFKVEKPSNWARWMVNVETAGKYKVFYYSVPTFAKFNSTRYAIQHDGKTSEITVDQSAAPMEGWQELGTYAFAAGKKQWVAVHDNTVFDVADDQHIIADAIRLLPEDESNHNQTNNGMNNATIPSNSNTHTGGNNSTSNGNNSTDVGTSSGNDDDGYDQVETEEGCSVASSRGSIPLLLLGFFLFFRRRKSA